MICEVPPSPSPNFDEREREIDMLILHYTGMKTAGEALARMCDPESKVSAHYMLEEDGKIHRLVAEEKRAWHAGISYWRGVENLNHNSIGIEIVNPGHEWGYRKFTKAQYDALIPLCAAIKNKYQIPDINIIGHSDIAPERKQDPGELFDWKLLAENGVGLFANAAQPSSHSTPQLTDLGYRSHDTHSITAFQRHWRQNKIDGIWDEECGMILTNLLAKL